MPGKLKATSAVAVAAPSESSGPRFTTSLVPPPATALQSLPTTTLKPSCPFPRLSPQPFDNVNVSVLPVLSGHPAHVATLGGVHDPRSGSSDPKLYTIQGLVSDAHTPLSAPAHGFVAVKHQSPPLCPSGFPHSSLTVTPLYAHPPTTAAAHPHPSTVFRPIGL